jgi:hypothetical protein
MSLNLTFQPVDFVEAEEDSWQAESHKKLTHTNVPHIRSAMMDTDLFGTSRLCARASALDLETLSIQLQGRRGYTPTNDGSRRIKQGSFRDKILN